MSTIIKNHGSDNPYYRSGSEICPGCRRRNCPCFAAGSSVTYWKVTRELKGVFGWSHRNPTLPKEAWAFLLNRLRTFRYRKGP